MDRYKNICYLETFRKDIFPIPYVKYYESDHIYLSIGSLILFKDIYTLNNTILTNKNNINPKNKEILLKCVIYKNTQILTNTIEIKINKYKPKKIQHGKKRTPKPTYRNYKHLNSSYISNNRAVKFKVVRSRFSPTIKRRPRLSTNKDPLFNCSKGTVIGGNKLRAPIIIKLNRVLKFKIQKPKNVVEYRLTNASIYLSIDLFVNSYYISTNKNQILAPRNQLDSVDSPIRGNYENLSSGYNKGCLYLYHRGVNNADLRLHRCINYNSTGCCCNLETGTVCHKHITDTINLISSIVATVRATSTPEACNFNVRHARFMLYKYLQVLYYLSSGDINICCESRPPVSLVTYGYGVPEGSTSGHSSECDYDYDVMCSSVNKILYRHTSLLAIDSRELLFVEIPTKFKLLQLLFRSSLLSISTGGSANEQQHEVKIFDKWHSYSDINRVVYKYYDQLSRSANSICLMLRFTDYTDERQLELLEQYLERIDAISDSRGRIASHSTEKSDNTSNNGTNGTITDRTTSINGTNGRYYGTNGIYNKKLSTSVLLELISADFHRLDDKIRKRVISIIIKHLKKRHVSKFLRQFLFFLKYDLDDTFFNYLITSVENDQSLALRTYFFLLSSTSTGISSNHVCDLYGQGDPNSIYLAYLRKYIDYLRTRRSNVLGLIELEVSFLSVFINIINRINETKKKYLLRNHYLNLMFNELISSTNNDSSMELRFDRAQKLLHLHPCVPLITDVEYSIRSIAYDRSHIYKSSNYPLILHLITAATTTLNGISNKHTPSNDTSDHTRFNNDTSDESTSDNATGDVSPHYSKAVHNFTSSAPRTPVDTSREVEQRIMLKMNYVRNDELCLEVLSLFKHILKRYKIPVLTYKLISVYNNLGYIQFLPNTTCWKSNTDANGGMESFKDNFINSFCVISILNYLLEVGDRHYENVLLQSDGFLINFDFNFIFGNDPNVLKKPPFRFSSGDFQMLQTLCAYDQFVSRFIFVFRIIRTSYKLVLNLLYASGVDISDVYRVEERFMLDLNGAHLNQRLAALIKESHTSYYPQLIDNWHRFTNLFK